LLIFKSKAVHLKFTTDKAEYEAKAVILASGRVPRKLGVRGEEEFRNKGVAYCATCDAPMFTGKDILVVGEETLLLILLFSLKDSK